MARMLTESHDTFKSPVFCLTPLSKTRVMRAQGGLASIMERPGPTSPTWAPTAVGAPPLSRAPLEATPAPFRTDVIGYESGHIVLHGTESGERYFVAARFMERPVDFDGSERVLLLRAQFEIVSRGQTAAVKSLSELGIAFERVVVITIHLPVRIGSRSAVPSLVRVGATNGALLLPALQELERILLEAGDILPTPLLLSWTDGTWTVTPDP